MGTRENECQISQKYIFHMKFSEFYMCNPILVQGFCPLKIKINQLVDSVLNSLVTIRNFR